MGRKIPPCTRRLFTILEKGKNVFAPLGEIAEVRFGLKTGANDFFYLEPLGIGSRHGLVRVRNNAGWEGEIEEEFLKPVIKSPRECSTTLVHPDSLKYTVFMCNRSKAALRGTRALEYIKWGKRKGIIPGLHFGLVAGGGIWVGVNRVCIFGP